MTDPDRATHHRHRWRGADFVLEDDHPWVRQTCACGATRSFRAWERYWAPAAGEPVLHMLPEEAWRQALVQGGVEPASLADEGFVHCTNGWTELANVGNRYYASDPRPYVALRLDLARAGAPWRHDDASGLYPHLYGPIPLVAVTGVALLARAANGRFLPPTEAPMNALAPLFDRLEAAAARLAATRDQVRRGEPWPAGAVAAGSGEADWVPTEVLAHVAEMLPFWLGEMERVVAGPDYRGGAGPTPFGRTIGDQVRGQTVIRDATLPARELYDRIGAAVERYRHRLPELTDADIARTGLHPTRGVLAVPELLDQLVVTHLEEHAAQLERALEA